MRAFLVRLPSGARYWTVLDENLAVVGEAVTAVRRHRAISLGMPRIRQPLPVTGTERTA